MTNTSAARLLALFVFAATLVLPANASAVLPQFGWGGFATPAGPTNAHTASFDGYNSSRNVATTVTCQITNNSFNSDPLPCTNGDYWFSAGSLLVTEGAHTLVVKATPTDSSSQVQTLTRDIVADWTAPTANAFGPSGTIVGHAAEFSFSANEDSTFQCRLDGDDSSWQSCTSPTSYNSIADDGAHTFFVRATDAAGNTGSAASRSFTINNAPPIASIQPIASPGNNKSPGIGISVDRPDAHAECRIDSGSWSNCDGEYQGSDLNEGSHTLEARAYLDGPTDVQAVPASYSFVIDLTAPEIHFTTGTTAYPGLNAEIWFASTSGDVDHFRCSVDGYDIDPCDSPLEWDWPVWDTNWQGDHTVTVWAIDEAGNWSDSLARIFRMYPNSPETTIDSAPDPTVAVATANFTFSSDTATDFQCSVDGGEYVACTKSWSVSGLLEGQHALSVRAVDPAGQFDDSPATAVFKSLAPPPVPTLTKLSASTKKISFKVSAPGKSKVTVATCKTKKVKGKSKTSCKTVASGNVKSKSAGTASFKLKKALRKRTKYRVTIVFSGSDGQETTLVKSVKTK